VAGSPHGEVIGEPLAYFSKQPDSDYWSELWGRESIDRLVTTAETSSLTEFLDPRIRRGDRLLEGGCGLGQYVLYFAARGVVTTGVDFSKDAVEAHLREYPASDVRCADLHNLPFDDESFDVYLSLGVIEHYRDGGRGILVEANRVLRPGGRLLLSTPYLNLSRRLLRPAIESRQREAARNGATFYQFAYDQESLERLLEPVGFGVEARGYYDVGRGIRDVRSLVRPPRAGTTANAEVPSPPSSIRRAVRTNHLALRVFAHMQIVCALRR
jgi:SAM-dependent methyltransferase